MSAPVTYRTAPGVVLSEQALLVGLGPLFRAHERETERAEQERIERRRAANRVRREANAHQASLV